MGQLSSHFIILLALQCIYTAAFQGFNRHIRHRLPSRGRTKLNIGGFGLTDDGDFAILGVNMQDPDEDVDDTSSLGQSLDGDISSLLTGTIFDGATKEISISTSPSQRINGSTQQASNHQGTVDNKTTFNIDEEAQAEIMEYLMEIMPTVSEDDIEQYSVGLSNIGFHPKCVTMCELKLDDLEFMKVLHRRYFFNEVTGAEHPWEA